MKSVSTLSQKTLWSRCQELLASDIPEQQLNTWIRPLQAVEDENQLKLLAPNRFVQDWVKQNFLKKIEPLARTLSENDNLIVNIEVGSSKPKLIQSNLQTSEIKKPKPIKETQN